MSASETLVAREALNFVKRLVRRFQNPPQPGLMQPQEFVQAQYIAIVVMLRAVGHIFMSRDADTDARLAWRTRHWNRFAAEPIFKEFINPGRNKLLKEFRADLLGGWPADQQLEAAFVIDPNMAEDGDDGAVTMVVDVDPKAVLPKIEAAIAFWDRYLCAAETDPAFQADRGATR